MKNGQKSLSFKHNIIAFCYDFDGTLSRRAMQEDTIFKEYGIDAKKFWAEVKRSAKGDGYDKTLCYLNRLIYDPEFQKRPLTKARLTELAKRIEYYPGVEHFFPYINEFARQEAERFGIQIGLEHYIISSGMKAILDGVGIKDHFEKIYACEYEYMDDGRPKCVKMAVNDTNKTQFLFRINKGCLRLDQDINEHMSEEKRRIPFQNMIYIGDGDSDVPCMAVTMKNGGYAIAVYPSQKNASSKCLELLHANRVHYIVPADFSSGSELCNLLESLLKLLINRISLDQISHAQH